MQDPTVYIKSIEGILDDFWEDLEKKEQEGEDPQKEFKKDIQDARLKSAELPSYFIATINMEGKAKRDDRVLLLSTIMSTYYSSIIFCQETPGRFKKDIVDVCGTSGYEHVENDHNAAILWRTEDFESSTDGLSTTDRSIIQIRERVNYTTELLSRIAMVKLTCRNSSETVLAVSWHGPHRGYSKIVGKRNAFNGLTTFLKEVCKAKNIPTFLIGGDFNLNTLDDELTLGKNVSVPVYELSHRQMKRSTQPSGYIPHKDNFVFLYGANITVSWTRPFEIEDPNAIASDLTEGGHENIRSKMASSKVTQVEEALDHDPINGVLQFLPEKIRKANRQANIRLCSSETGEQFSERQCISQVNNNNSNNSITVNKSPVDETSSSVENTKLSKSSPNESTETIPRQQTASRSQFSHRRRYNSSSEPEDFEADETLSNSEVYTLLRESKAWNERAEEQELPEGFMKALHHTQKFSKFKNRETITHVKRMLGRMEINQFEQTSLANLCPKTAKEAKDLIPSLEDKVDDDVLEQLLEDIQTIISY